MFETKKSRPFRESLGYFDTVFVGAGIDIGCGKDKLRAPKGLVDSWDKPQGDAQLMSGVPDEKYDFVYSSHCLEHMVDYEEALTNWLRILKSRGSLYVVVPDLVLYEHNVWPSQYNKGHHWNFFLADNHYPEAMSSVERAYKDLAMPALNEKSVNVHNMMEKLKSSRHIVDYVIHLNDSGYEYSDLDSDQTMGVACAQIEILATKN